MQLPSIDSDFRIGMDQLRIVLAVYIIVNIIHLTAFITSLTTMDGKKWGKYAFIIIFTIGYFLATFAAIGLIGASFDPSIKDLGFNCKGNGSSVTCSL